MDAQKHAFKRPATRFNDDKVIVMFLLLPTVSAGMPQDFTSLCLCSSFLRIFGEILRMVGRNDSMRVECFSETRELVAGNLNKLSRFVGAIRDVRLVSSKELFLLNDIEV